MSQTMRHLLSQHRPDIHDEGSVLRSLNLFSTNAFDQPLAGFTPAVGGGKDVLSFCMGNRQAEQKK
jgi:hypothetical protein